MTELIPLGEVAKMLGYDSKKMAALIYMGGKYTKLRDNRTKDGAKGIGYLYRKQDVIDVINQMRKEEPYIKHVQLFIAYLYYYDDINLLSRESGINFATGCIVALSYERAQEMVQWVKENKPSLIDDFCDFYEDDGWEFLK